MSILLAPAALGFAIVLHGIVMRVQIRLDVVKRFLLVGVPIGMGLAALSIALAGFTVEGCAPILLYAFLCELYIFCFTLVLSSVSAILLVMLRDGPVEFAALSRVYDPDEMVRLRLRRLLDNGFIERVNERLAVTEKGMRYHRTFSSMRVFFGHRSGC